APAALRPSSFPDSVTFKKLLGLRLRFSTFSSITRHVGTRVRSGDGMRYIAGAEEHSGSYLTSMVVHSCWDSPNDFQAHKILDIANPTNRSVDVLKEKGQSHADQQAGEKRYQHNYAAAGVARRLRDERWRDQTRFRHRVGLNFRVLQFPGDGSVGR